jgi:hypothetical protein
MLHWKEFSAWVAIDGKETLEYDVEISEDQKTVTCWIASELGKVTIRIFASDSILHTDCGSMQYRNFLSIGKTLHSTELSLGKSKWTELVAGEK